MSEATRLGDATYQVLTWDPDLLRFTPQRGVPPIVRGMYGLKAAVRRLRALGYECTRDDGYVLIRRRGRHAG